MANAGQQPFDVFEREVLDIDTIEAFENEAAKSTPHPGDIFGPYDLITMARLRQIAAAITAWQRVRQRLRDQEQVVAAARADVFGEEHQERTTFQDYSNAEQKLQTSWAALFRVTERLNRRRGPAWKHSTSGEWLRQLLAECKDPSAAQRVKIHHIQQQRAEIERNMAERRRRALGQFNSSWLGSWSLGEGAFGSASAWVKQDSNGEIIDRLVVKDTNLQGRPEWNDANLWTGGGSGNTGSVPNEVQAMYNLRGKIGSETIVKIRNWRIDRRRQMYRIMMEYCPLKDLSNITRSKYYFKKSSRPREVFPDVNLLTTELEDLPRDCPPKYKAALELFRSGRPPMIPEPFICSVLEGLATAGLLMERGELDSRGMLRWDQIIHCDLKPDNVFLSRPDGSKYSGYPQIKVGDFGLALLLEPGDKRRPEEFKVKGTRIWAAPEQVHFKANENDDLKAMSSATNVYATGLIIWNLLSGQVIPRPPQDDAASHAPEPPRFRRVHFDPPPHLDVTGTAFYSPELQALTYEMCRLDDTLRPTFHSILKRLRRFIGRPGHPAGELRTARYDAPGYEDESYLHLGEGVDLFDDAYAVGMALDDVDVFDGSGFRGDAGDWPPPPPPPFGGDDDDSDGDTGGSGDDGDSGGSGDDGDSGDRGDDGDSDSDISDDLGGDPGAPFVYAHAA